MTKKLLLTLGFALSLTTMPTTVFADDELTQAETSLSEDVKQPNYEAALKDKFGLTDAQLKTMHDKGMNNQQITMAAALSKESGKTVDEIVKMRTEDKMGWGKIAKELGVKPGTIGQSIAGMRHDVNEKRAEKRSEKVDEKQAKRDEKREEKREARELKRTERKEKKGNG